MHNCGRYVIIFLLSVVLQSCATKRGPLAFVKASDNRYYLSDYSSHTADGAIIQQLIDFAGQQGGGTIILEKDKTYSLEAPLKITHSNVNLDLNNAIIDGQRLDSNNAGVIAIMGRSKEVYDIELVAIPTQITHLTGDFALDVDDVCLISSSEILQRARGYYTKSEWVKVKARTDNSIRVSRSLLSYMDRIQVDVVSFVNNCSISNGTILCNRATRSNGISSSYIRNCRISNVVIEDAVVAGVNVSKSFKIVIDSCSVVSVDCKNIGLNYGILVSRSQECVISNNFCQTLRTGIDQSLSHYIVISDNRVLDCGISPHAGTNITISGNEIVNGSIYMRAFDSVIENNRISLVDSDLGGIVLAEVEGKSGFVISGNVIDFQSIDVESRNKGDSFGIGIYSAQSDISGVSVKNNIINNAAIGISITRSDNRGGNHSLEVVGNSINDFSDIGIRTNRFSNQVLQRNKISGKRGASYGIFLWANGGNFENIDIAENQISGVRTGVSVSKSYKVAARENLFDNVGKSGL